MSFGDKSKKGNKKPQPPLDLAVEPDFSQQERFTSGVFPDFWMIKIQRNSQRKKPTRSKDWGF